MAINSDTIEGSMDEFGGKAKSAVGNAFGDTKTQAEGALDQAKGKVQDAYGKARDAVKDWADDAPEYVQKAKETGRRYAEQGSEKVKEVVQDQPVAVLAGGIALGFLVGWLAGGRRS